MQFLVTAYDYRVGALERRFTVREQHLKLLQELKEQKRCLYAARLENGNKSSIGSVMIFEYPTRKELDDMLATEPYIKNNVWDKIEIVPCVVADMFK